MTSSNEQLPTQLITANVLDELCFIPASLDSRLKEFKKVDLTSRFSAAEKHAKTRITSPFVLRALINSQWHSDQIDELCGAMRSVGGAVVAESKTLSRVAISNIPFRSCPVFVDSCPDTAELESADIVELQLFAKDNATLQLNPRVAQWPWDVMDTERLAKKIEVLRQLAGSTIPVGVAIPAGAVRDDVTLLIRCGADFVTLVNRSDAIESPALPDPWIAVTARNAANQAGNPNLPIFLAASIRNGSDIAKLVALGVNGFVVDGLASPQSPTKTATVDPMSYSRLSDITSGFAVTNPPAPSDTAVDVLTRLVSELTHTLKICGYENLAALSDKHLFATSNRAQQLTGIPMLRP